MCMYGVKKKENIQNDHVEGSVKVVPVKKKYNQGQICSGTIVRHTHTAWYEISKPNTIGLFIIDLLN